MKLLQQLPIFQRLFFTFTLAGLLPGGIIVIQGYLYTRILAGMHLDALAGPFLGGTIFAVCLSTIVVVTLGYLVNLTITQPLSHLAAVARRISQGETSARTKLTGNDELALVASSLNLMLERIEKLVRETRGQRDYLQAGIDKLVAEVSGIGEGNLTMHAEVTNDDLGVLADAFNYMVMELSKLVLRVKQVVKEVEEATGQTAQQMVHLVEDTTQQIRQTETATHQVGQMALMSQQLETLAQELGRSAQETSQAAQQGRTLLQRTSAGIEQIHQAVHGSATSVMKLSQRSEEINELVAVISTIAHQTNRLALDASIQAAMAGEHGKGFTAVATDIRRFAEQTKEHVHKITSIVRQVREEIASATHAMRSTEEATTTGANFIRETQQSSLLTIFRQVEQQAEEIEQMRSLVTRQLQGSRITVELIQEIATIAVHSEQRTRLVMHQMEVLTTFARQLQRSVEVFHVQSEVTPLFGTAPKPLVEGHVAGGDEGRTMR
jgi:methyl-accepting chemotaxis protein